MGLHKKTSSSRSSPKGSKTSKSETATKPIPRVGYWFQAEIPNFIPPQEREPKRCSETLQADFNLAWSPNHNIPEKELESYIQFSKEKSGFNEDQSLALLKWHQYNVEKAIEDQCTLEVCSDVWTQKEINRFKSSKHLGTKNFFKLHRQLTKKTHETDDFYKDTAKCVSLYYRLKVKKMKSMGGIVKYKAAKKLAMARHSRSGVESEQ